MNETLWGVAIGGAVAVVSALITSVVGPAMTARHQRASTRAERLLVAVAELDEATDRWGLDDEFKPFGPSETAVVNALRRLANASNSTLLHLAIDQAVEAVTEVGAVPKIDENYPANWNSAMTHAINSVDDATRIAADMVDPPFLPIRVTRWVKRYRPLRRSWLARRRHARIHGA